MLRLVAFWFAMGVVCMNFAPTVMMNFWGNIQGRQGKQGIQSRHCRLYTLFTLSTSLYLYTLPKSCSEVVKKCFGIDLGFAVAQRSRPTLLRYALPRFL